MSTGSLLIYFSNFSTYPQILLQGHIGINRAVDGDVVAIEILLEEEWRRPSDIVLEDKVEDDPGDVLQVRITHSKSPNKLSETNFEVVDLIGDPST